MRKRKREEQSFSSSSNFSDVQRPETAQNSIKRTTLGRAKEERRLDSLARLLEGGSACAAVCYVNDEILVTNNKIKTPSSERMFGSADAQLMNRVLQHFVGYADSFQKAKEDKKEDDYVLLTDICAQKIKTMNSSLQGDPYHQAISIDVTILKEAVKFLHNENSQQNYITKRDESIAACLSHEENNLWMSSKGQCLSEITQGDRRRIVCGGNKVLQIEKT